MVSISDIVPNKTWDLKSDEPADACSRIELERII